MDMRKDLNKLFAITKQEPEKRTHIIKKYKQKEMKMQNRENINNKRVALNDSLIFI